MSPLNGWASFYVICMTSHNLAMSPPGVLSEETTVTFAEPKYYVRDPDRANRLARNARRPNSPRNIQFKQP